MYNVVIRNGIIVDGTGGPEYEADVAIEGDRIVKIEKKIIDKGGREIDATGCIVTPGFVDVHTHYDAQILWTGELTPSSRHGVTTVVAGNCGVGFAPVRPDDRETLVELMEGVEDIRRADLDAGIEWAWESFNEYMDYVGKRNYNVDVGLQIPHGALRLYIMGGRALAGSEATEEDIKAMGEAAAAAVAAGAIGFSTSRSSNHRSSNGDPMPTLRASEAELAGIARAIGATGKGVLQFISDFSEEQGDDFEMIAKVVGLSGRPASVSVTQRHWDPNGWRKIMDGMARAKEKGIDIKAQVASRPVGILFGFNTSRGPFENCPTLKNLRLEGTSDLGHKLRDPEIKSKIIRETKTHPGIADTSGKSEIDYSYVFPLGNPPCYEPSAENSIAAIAERNGKSEEEVAYDIMLEDGGEGLLISTFLNYADRSLDVVREMLCHDRSILGLGDGGAHVGAICDASFQTHMLAYWGRDRERNRLDVPYIVHKMSGLTAAAMGLHDRGIIKVGKKADINVIDAKKLQLGLPRIKFDLPSGGRRLDQPAFGYKATLVSGIQTVEEDRATGNLPGRLIRTGLLKM